MLVWFWISNPTAIGQEGSKNAYERMARSSPTGISGFSPFEVLVNLD